MFVDEFRAALSHPLAAKAFEDYLFEGRELNLAVWLVIQELSRDAGVPAEGRGVGADGNKDLFAESCKRASQGGTTMWRWAAATWIRSLSRSDAEVGLLRDVGGRQPFDFARTGAGDVVAAGFGDADRATFDGLIQRYGRPRAAAEWLRRRQLPAAAHGWKVSRAIGDELAAKEAAQYA